MSNGIPLVEFYRPTKFEDIVLDPLNKEILKNIIETSYFPNLLFYGPPGTGKTTSIINLVNAYQEKNNQKNKGLMIHLNASDERGIDIIRSQINQFVNSKTLFNKGMKFVILDEVDYMTKNAQQALRYLLQDYSSTVRFCLICNYISRIDEGLQNEFLRLRFNQLPEKDITSFLSNICEREGFNISQKSLTLIQRLYNSDIRSMVNFLQSNQNMNCDNIIDESIWEFLFNKFEVGEKIENINIYIQNISEKFNIDKKNIIKDFLNYIIRNKEHIISSDFLNLIENIMHNQDCKNLYFINYSLLRLSSFIPKLKESTQS
uniref:AAA+ ATPase domain-containing protein n=1 Tax=viral metagenome TaxID=1070528 RepID=A0A6C0KUL6_9ZZZZ